MPGLPNDRASGSTIEIVGVGKCYRLGDRAGVGTARDALTNLARSVASPRQRRSHDDLWALRDVDLAIEAGESIGVIGRNGSGKSTLLKIITRITEPTEGVCRTRGRVGAMLEVGTGFHPELTGRENVFLNGAILGMARRVTASRFDEIVAFAGLERFIDTPVKRYSSGMALRLAFAVAAHLDAEIIVIDEVLAVGDAEFQRKCLEAMQRLCADGRTVVFTSHDLSAISRLCARTVWLDQGRIAAVGPSGEVIAKYLGSGAAGVAAAAVDVGDHRARLTGVALAGADGTPRSAFGIDESISVSVAFELPSDLAAIDVAVLVSTPAGVRVLDEASSDRNAVRPSGRGEYVARVTLPAVLNIGTYRVGVWLGDANDEFVFVEQALTFEIHGTRDDRPERLVRLGLDWHIEERSVIELTP